MKKFIFTLLFIIPFCKAADPDEIWNKNKSKLMLMEDQIETIPDGLNLPQLEMLNLTNNLITAIPDNLNLPLLERLYLDGNKIREIPENLYLPGLKTLNLGRNQITYVDPQILNQFPMLKIILLDQNPLTQKNVDALKEAAVKAGRKDLEIRAVNLTIPFVGIGTKGAATKR